MARPTPTTGSAGAATSATRRAGPPTARWRGGRRPAPAADDALAAAACIVRAHRASGERFGSSSSWPEPENEIYWHTREALCERRQELGLRIGQYLMKLSAAYMLEQEELERVSELLWVEVCHPEVLVREVMET